MVEAMIPTSVVSARFESAGTLRVEVRMGNIRNVRDRVVNLLEATLPSSIKKINVLVIRI